MTGWLMVMDQCLVLQIVQHLIAQVPVRLQGTLTVGEIATYTATYTISQNAANTGLISNIVSATASSPGQTNNVTDTSDDGDDTDGNTIDDPTIVTTESAGRVEVTKVASVYRFKQQW